jgi:hypothetical protein
MSGNPWINVVKGAKDLIDFIKSNGTHQAQTLGMVRRITQSL